MAESKTYKVVYNRCFGGFSLSESGMRRYAEIKGLPFFPEKNERYSFTTYWIVPPDQRTGILSEDAWRASPIEERRRSNELHGELTLDDHRFVRHDPALVQVVEELGAEANGLCAELGIVEVSGPYRIDEYDGRETVMEASDYTYIDPTA
jgi:hypothetical protein